MRSSAMSCDGIPRSRVEVEAENEDTSLLNALYRQFKISDLLRSSNGSFWLEVWLFDGIEFGDDARLKTSSKTQCAISRQWCMDVSASNFDV